MACDRCGGTDLQWVNGALTCQSPVVFTGPGPGYGMPPTGRFGPAYVNTAGICGAVDSRASRAPEMSEEERQERAAAAAARAEADRLRDPHRAERDAWVARTKVEYEEALPVWGRECLEAFLAALREAGQFGPRPKPSWVCVVDDPSKRLRQRDLHRDAEQAWPVFVASDYPGAKTTYVLADGRWAAAEGAPDGRIAPAAAQEFPHGSEVRVARAVQELAEGTPAFAVAWPAYPVREPVPAALMPGPMPAPGS